MARARAAGLPAGFFLLTMLTGLGAPLANPQPMTAGDSPASTTSTEVAIAREELLINIREKDAEVRVALWLENRGKASTMQVGFPCDVDPEDNVSTLPCKTKIQISLDGRKLSPKQRATSKTVHNWIWPMHLAKGGKVKLDIAYDAPLGEQDIWLTEALFYRLVTGARWAGPIGQLEIEVRTPLEGLAFIAPPGYTRSPGKIRWSLSGYEPREDLVLLPASNFAELPSARDGLSEWERISAIERALESMRKEPERLIESYIPLRLFGSRWPTDAGAFRRCLDESAALLEAKLPPSWRLWKQRLAANGSKASPSEALKAYLEDRGYFPRDKTGPQEEPRDRVAATDRLARAWLDRFAHDPGIAVQVAAANALAGDARGADRLRNAVADGPALEVAHGLALLHIPVCQLIEKQLPDAWATFIMKTAVPASPAGSFGLGQKLDQRETRLRLLQLMSEGADGGCLSFVTEEARSEAVSAEERALAQAILQRGKASSTKAPSLDELDRKLRDRDERVRLAAVAMLAARRDAPAARFRAALRQSDFCESRLLAGATLEEAKQAPNREGCSPDDPGTLYSALLAVGNHQAAADLLRQPGALTRLESAFVRHLGEWLAARRAAAEPSR